VLPSAVYYANRAFAHTKLENYGAAVEDATEAIRLDPEYIKVRVARCTPSRTCSLTAVERLHCVACELSLSLLSAARCPRWSECRQPSDPYQQLAGDITCCRCSADGRGAAGNTTPPPQTVVGDKRHSRA
jgi:hypothetical protein